MFEKKTYLYSENMGVCFVEDITKLVTAQKKEVLYYVLKPVYQKDKSAYIPVENHTVELRELISVEKAKEQLFSYPELLDLAMELGLVEKEEGEEEERPESIDPLEEKEQERKRLAILYKMADTLPFEERSALYQRGEVEFVLRRSMEPEEDKKKRKKKS